VLLQTHFWCQEVCRTIVYYSCCTNNGRQQVSPNKSHCSARFQLHHRCHHAKLTFALQPCQSWAARYNSWLTIRLMPTAIAFSFLLIFFPFHPCETWGGLHVTGFARQPVAGQRRRAGQHRCQGPAHARGLNPTAPQGQC